MINRHHDVRFHKELARVFITILIILCAYSPCVYSYTAGDYTNFSLQANKKTIQAQSLLSSAIITLSDLASKTQALPQTLNEKNSLITQITTIQTTLTNFTNQLNPEQTYFATYTFAIQTGSSIYIDDSRFPTPQWQVDQFCTRALNAVNLSQTIITQVATFQPTITNTSTRVNSLNDAFNAATTSITAAQTSLNQAVPLATEANRLTGIAVAAARALPGTASNRAYLLASIQLIERNSSTSPETGTAPAVTTLASMKAQLSTLMQNAATFELLTAAKNTADDIKKFTDAVITNNSTLLASITLLATTIECAGKESTIRTMLTGLQSIALQIDARLKTISHTIAALSDSVPNKAALTTQAETLKNNTTVTPATGITATLSALTAALANLPANTSYTSITDAQKALQRITLTLSSADAITAEINRIDGLVTDLENEISQAETDYQNKLIAAAQEKAAAEAAAAKAVQEKIEAERIAAEKAAADAATKAAEEKAEADRIAAAQAAAEAATKAAEEKATQEKAAADTAAKAAEEKAEAERIAAAQAAAEAATKAAEAKAAEEKATQEKAATDAAAKNAAEKAEAERIAAAQAAAEAATKAAEEKAAEEKATQEKAATDAAAAKIAAEKAEAARIAAEKAAADAKTTSEKTTQEKETADAAAAKAAEEKAAADKLAADTAAKAAVEKAETARIAAEKAVAEKLAADTAAKLAAEKAAADKLAADTAAKAAADKAEAARIAAEKAEAERIAAEKAAQRKQPVSKLDEAIASAQTGSVAANTLVERSKKLPNSTTSQAIKNTAQSLKSNFDDIVRKLVQAQKSLSAPATRTLSAAKIQSNVRTIENYAKTALSLIKQRTNTMTATQKKIDAILEAA
jgi:hypothetical protein